MYIVEIQISTYKLQITFSFSIVKRSFVCLCALSLESRWFLSVVSALGYLLLIPCACSEPLSS